MTPVPNAQSGLNDWLNHLMAIHPTEIDMGLGRVAAVAKVMGLDSLEGTKVVTVAGTNGKGTTCAMIEAIMREAGQRVGVYSSPHMLKYNERVRIDGVDASDEALIEAFCAIDAARGDTSLTFFEYATLAGLYLFKQAKLDLVLLEVGLGGRLDATNIIDADIAVITAIDIDHQEYLGDTRELVGREKAGIMRAGRPAVIGDPDLPVSVVEYAESIGAKMVRVNHEFSYQASETDWCFELGDMPQSSVPQFSLSGLPLPTLPLANAATALAVVQLLLAEQFVTEAARTSIAAGLSGAKLTGRLEVVSEQPKIILDVAHNPHAAAYLAQRLEAYKGKRIFALCGMLKDKDCRAVLGLLEDQIHAWYLTDLNCERSAKAQDLLSYLTGDKAAYGFASVEQAYQALKPEIGQSDVVIVFGSFYTVAEFKQLDLS
ncbi:bifunctional tetrahydrofolate synthase/dihydrofolate synthase [Shewanella alkalitolerans]|uniref:bifunctional tetrahydrofolate synthase/dihydrofolate synthase n=1 Tax=Shewanella alkalitolerans TaxID=2864209 RepID=UPI001C65A141|nr:bifunctional tetrahydrofolate synthase/dihydrofolate synthase [Shewanella alkalitolerans]QYJ96234.1 bifunctional tetrahydrofolate synthase/dihydrofolate synthase [Shewanella alkalitolerans]